MNRLFRNVSLCIALSAASCTISSAQVKGKTSTSSQDASAKLKASIRHAQLGPWRLTSFETITVSPTQNGPWFPFLDATMGYAASFINSSVNIPNRGKGGASQGVRHPEFSVWIFPRTTSNSVKHFNETIYAHQMVQDSAPVVVGANQEFILTCVGDLENAESPVKEIAKTLDIKFDGGSNGK